MMMKNIKNRSGFTMIELLATITILGILMAVAIGAVSWILDLNEKRYYSTLEKNVALAAGQAPVSRAGTGRALIKERICTQILQSVSKRRPLGAIR